MPGKYATALNTGQPLYASEKIGEWLRQSGTGAYTGDTPIQLLRESMKAFRDRLAETDSGDDIIKYEMTLVTYALDQFESYINHRSSDIPNHQAAEVYQNFLHYQWKRFREWADDLDQEAN